MRTLRYFIIALSFTVCPTAVHADARPGSIEFSDGHKLAGAISLTPGKDLRLFTATGQVSIELNEVKELSFKPEKEEMREGFNFPNAGQATQAKTGEVYPTRSLQTEITLADGKILDGHLFTTTLYVESDTVTEKVVLMAKQTWTNGQKLSDLVYPTLIHFNDAAVLAGSSQIDLSESGLSITHAPIVVTAPELAVLPVQETPVKQVWTVPQGNASILFLSIETSNGIHVMWPQEPIANNGIIKGWPSPSYPPAVDDPAIHQAVQTALTEMQDFYDTRTLLGCFAEEDDVYSLVMMKRLGPTDSFKADKIPWSLVLLHWKYDRDAKKPTLLNRVSLAMGRSEGNSPLPQVFKEPELSRNILTIQDTLKKDSTP